MPADAATVEKATGVPLGFLGPVGIKIPLVIDRAITAMATVVVGGNEVDVHLKGVIPGRDFHVEQFEDIRNAEAGDACPRCGTALAINAGLEIGHVFKLGTKYSKSMGATYLDEKGNEVHIIMGCYGIGINRIVAAAVEAGNDKNGIVWPLAIAPYHVLVVPLQVQNAAVLEQALALEKSLTAAGLDVLTDDRDQRPGVKFKDADLIGIPLRVVIGERGLKDGTLEIKWRDQPEPKHIPAATAVDTILTEISAANERHQLSCRERLKARAAVEEIMNLNQRLPALPYVLLGAMTLVSFGGPVAMLVVIRGGSSARMAPRPCDRMAHDRRDLRPVHHDIHRLCVD